MLRVLTYSQSIFNGIIMIILDIRTWYNFCGLGCQKGKKEKKSTGTLRCLSHASDLLGFGVWHMWSPVVLHTSSYYKEKFFGGDPRC